MTVQDLWDAFDTPIDEEECIDEPFLHFPIGTHREDIWHWFEATFRVPVHHLMDGLPEDQD